MKNLNGTNGINLKGYQFADGVHWHWEEKEIAVIDNHTSEIEWCVRKHTLPQEVIDAVREKRTKPSVSWTIDVKRFETSATSEGFDVNINGETISRFHSEKILNSNGKWVSKIEDKELGKFVRSMFWHKYDNLYHFSSKAKKAFDPSWNEEANDELPIFNDHKCILLRLSFVWDDGIDKKEYRLYVPKSTDIDELKDQLNKEHHFLCREDDCDIYGVQGRNPDTLMLHICDKHGWVFESLEYDIELCFN